MEDTNAERSAMPRTRLGDDFSRMAVRSPVGGTVQTKLAVNQPGDEHEQEADRISEELVRTPALARQSRRGPAEMQVERADDHSSARTEAPSVVQQVLGSAGHPLDSTTRGPMESSFQFDFGRVRVHHDEAAERAAAGLSARAFTLGSEIVFGRGHYAPGTTEGRKLLGHELTHVVQQSRSLSRVLQRAPLLKGKSQQEFGESDAATIDKAIAASPITKWVPAKNLTKLTGNVDTEDPVVFEKQFQDFGKSNENVDEVPGFVDRTKKKPVKLRLPGRNAAGQLVTAARIEAAVHETVHLNSNPQFQSTFGHSYNEGVTQYFTEMVLGESGRAYPDNLKLAQGLVAALTEDEVGRAYFQGDKAPYDKVRNALTKFPGGNRIPDWFKARDKKPPDWKTANDLLRTVLSAAAQPAAPAHASPAASTESRKAPE